MKAPQNSKLRRRGLADRGEKLLRLPRVQHHCSSAFYWLDASAVNRAQITMLCWAGAEGYVLFAGAGEIKLMKQFKQSMHANF